MKQSESELIFELEKELHQPEARKNLSRLKDLLAESFFEFGIVRSSVEPGRNTFIFAI